MLAPLPTPQISTNGNGHHEVSEIVAPKIEASKPARKQINVTEQEKKQAQRKTRTNKLNAQTAQHTQMIENFKDSLLKSAANASPLLSGCYNNWLNSHIADEKGDVAAARTPKGRKHAEATLKAWKRASELFDTLSPIVLDGLIQDIAAQIELEFKDVDRLAASDVPNMLRNVDLFDLMEHIN